MKLNALLKRIKESTTRSRDATWDQAFAVYDAAMILLGERTLYVKPGWSAANAEKEVTLSVLAGELHVKLLEIECIISRGYLAQIIRTIQVINELKCQHYVRKMAFSRLSLIMLSKASDVKKLEALKKTTKDPLMGKVKLLSFLVGKKRLTEHQQAGTLIMTPVGEADLATLQRICEELAEAYGAPMVQMTITICDVNGSPIAIPRNIKGIVESSKKKDPLGVLVPA
jgi:hypothetical protein